MTQGAELLSSTSRLSWSLNPQWLWPRDPIEIRYIPAILDTRTFTLYYGASKGRVIHMCYRNADEPLLSGLIGRPTARQAALFSTRHGALLSR